jgi:hypothetical protein
MELDATLRGVTKVQQDLLWNVSVSLRQHANNYHMFERASLYMCIHKLFNRGILSAGRRYFYYRHEDSFFSVAEYVGFTKVKDNVWRY